MRKYKKQAKSNVCSVLNHIILPLISDESDGRVMESNEKC